MVEKNSGCWSEFDMSSINSFKISHTSIKLTEQNWSVSVDKAQKTTQYLFIWLLFNSVGERNSSKDLGKDELKKILFIFSKDAKIEEWVDIIMATESEFKEY